MVYVFDNRKLIKTTSNLVGLDFHTLTNSTYVYWGDKWLNNRCVVISDNDVPNAYKLLLLLHK